MKKSENFQFINILTEFETERCCEKMKFSHVGIREKNRREPEG